LSTFNSVIPVWKKTSDPWTIEKILMDIGKEKEFKIQSRDLDILQALLEHRFLTTPQLNRLFFTDGKSGMRYTQRRLKVFFEIGLVMRIRPKDPNELGTKPNIFALTDLGFDLLMKVGRIKKDDQSYFYSERDNLIEFSYIIHDLHLNEICLEIFEEANRRKLSFEWLPTKLCRQKLKMPDGKFRIIEPDAIFIFNTPNKQIVLHIEYERSADDRRFKEKLTKWKLYRGQQAWKERFGSEPFVCVIGEREGLDTGFRKRRVVKSIKPLLRIAYNDAFKRICFLPVDEIFDHTWNCLPYPDNSLSLWEELGLD
jgi:hypothetical protein